MPISKKKVVSLTTNEMTAKNLAKDSISWKNTFKTTTILSKLKASLSNMTLEELHAFQNKLSVMKGKKRVMIKEGGDTELILLDAIESVIQTKNVATQKAAEEAANKKAAEEEARKKATEEAAKKAAEEAAKKAAEEATKKAAEEEARKKAAEEEATKEAANKKVAEEEATKKETEEAPKKEAENPRRFTPLLLVVWAVIVLPFVILKRLYQWVRRRLSTSEVTKPTQSEGSDTKLESEVNLTKEVPPLVTNLLNTSTQGTTIGVEKTLEMGNDTKLKNA